jgi:Flp pilus assembly protein TadD
MSNTSAILETAIDHHQAGRLAEAEKLYREVLSADPQCASAWNLLGVMASQLNRHEVALQCLQNALQFDPNSPEIYYNVGMALQGLSRLDEAIAAYQRVIEVDPIHARAYNNIGAVLKDRRQFSEAMACLDRALQLDPNMAQAYCNMGNTFQAQSRWGEARPCFERAIALDPDSAAAHTNYAMVLLASGEYDRGWAEYEWRWKAGQLPQLKFDRPRWDGAALTGKTILLHAEQGLGDVLQFIRYAPLVKALGAAVIVECPKPLVRLLASCSGIDRIIPTGEEPPAFDFHAPLLSLPRLFSTTVATIPASIPYLSAEAGLVDYWRQKLRGLTGFRIAINWRGRTGHGFFRLRDIALEHFASLAPLPISLVSLQQGASSEEVAELNARLPTYYPGDDFDQSHGSFMDTAAIMRNVDLVISSDTSLPHLAGALGVPTWIGLPFVAGWQWMREGAGSPWYPSVRLFRQKSHGGWKGVFGEIRAALVEHLQTWESRTVGNGSC